MGADRAYRNGATQGATPLGLVVMLYDQLERDLRQAQTALAQGDIFRRTEELAHAHTVIGFLQGSLNREQGGTVAAHLDRMYELMRARLLTAQIQSSAEILDEQIGITTSLRQAWAQADAEQNGQKTTATANGWVSTAMQTMKQTSNPMPQSQTYAITTGNEDDVGGRAWSA